MQNETLKKILFCLHVTYEVDWAMKPKHLLNCHSQIRSLGIKNNFLLTADVDNLLFCVRITSQSGFTEDTEITIPSDENLELGSVLSFNVKWVRT